MPSVFYYDFVDPECYLAAERIVSTLGEVPEFQPIDSAALADCSTPAVSAAMQVQPWSDSFKRAIELRAREFELQRIVWPPQRTECELALCAATYAKQIGRIVAFTMALFRQTYAAGRDLADENTILLAGAACEMHPAALLKGAALRSIRERLNAATVAARSSGVTDLPAVRVGSEVFTGTNAVEGAARQLVKR